MISKTHIVVQKLPGRQLDAKVLSVVKDWVHYISTIKIEYVVYRFLGHVLILFLDEIYKNKLQLTLI